MRIGTKSLCTMIDGWASENMTVNNNNNNKNWYSTIIADKGDKVEIGIANDFSTIRNHFSELEAQLEELKTKKNRRKLKIKVKM